MASGIRDFSITFVAKIVCLLFGIGTLSCMTWFLGPEGFGSYSVCLIFATLLNLVFAFGSDYATIYFVSSNRFTPAEGISTASVFGGLSSCLAIGTGLILMQYPSAYFEKAPDTAFYLALAFIPASLFSFTFLNLLTAVHQFAWFSAINIACSALNLVLVIIFVGLFSWGIHGALLSQLIVATLTILTTLLFFRLKYRITWVCPSLKGLRDIFHYGTRYYLGKISNMVNFRIGTIILAFFATTSQVGLFDFAMLLTSKIMIIPDALSTVLIPKVASDKTGKTNVIAWCSRMTIWACGLLLVILVLFAKTIIVLLFSPEFLDTVPVIRILALGIFVRCACKVFVPYLLGTNHPGFSSISVAAGMIVNLIALWLLLPRLGLPGAALAVTFSYFVSSMILMISFSKFSQMSPAKIWNFQRSDWSTLFAMLRRN